MNSSYYSKHIFLNVINKLLTELEWRCELIQVYSKHENHEKNEEHESKSEELELWLCNLVGYMQELIGNPTFQDDIVYASMKVYTESQSET